jgi:hypothetical protein
MYLNLVIDQDETSIELKAVPPPLQGLINQNPQLVFVCNPVIGVGGVGLSILGQARVVVGDDAIRRAAGNDLGALLTGAYTAKIKSVSYPLEMKPLFIDIGGQRYAGVGDMKPKVVSFTLRPLSP